MPSGPFSFDDATIFTDGTGFVVGSGNPALATGAPRGALSIQTQGWYPNAIAIGAGDMIGLAGRLYIATEAITASGTGTATIPIAPPLDVTVPGARRGDFADASLDTSSIAVNGGDKMCQMAG